MLRYNLSLRKDIDEVIHFNYHIFNKCLLIIIVQFHFKWKEREREGGGKFCLVLLISYQKYYLHPYHHNPIPFKKKIVDW